MFLLEGGVMSPSSQLTAKPPLTTTDSSQPLITTGSSVTSNVPPDVGK